MLKNVQKQVRSKFLLLLTEKKKYRFSLMLYDIIYKYIGIPEGAVGYEKKYLCCGHGGSHAVAILVQGQ